MTNVDRRRLITSMTATAAAVPSRAALGANLQAPTCHEGLSFLLANSDRISDIRGGWAPIIAAAIEKMLIIDPEVEIRQIKQKIGGLRIYYRSERYEEMRAIVQEAELICDKTCEECGKRGSLCTQRRGWIRTLCEEHRGDRESDA